MNADELTHMIRQICSQQQVTRYFAYGHISSYDVNLHRVRVTFPAMRDEDGNEVLSPWMPLSAVWVGDGFGMQVAPVGGEQCIVDLIESQHGVQVCANLLYNTVMPPPGGLDAGEALLKHMTGSFFKFHANGDVETNTQGNAIIMSAKDVNVTATGEVNITSATAVNVTAPEINLGANSEGLLDALTSAAATLFNGHTHGGVQTGSGHTAGPDQSMGADQMTSVVKVG